jgi:hypothetical protein
MQFATNVVIHALLALAFMKELRGKRAQNGPICRVG